MAYEVTATRKRPRGFDELAGQEFVVATLASSLKSGQIANAYLFAGPRGVGKTSAARIVAKALNCETGPSASPCGTCSNCVEIARGACIDVIEIDGASNTSVNDVREIRDEVLFAPSNCRYKVYIIDEVHMLSNSAFNALLKTIEEPPPHVVFLFATTELQKVPATIRSRCQQFNFRLIPLGVIKERLAALCRETGVEAEDEALFWMAREAAGSLRDAFTLFDQVVSFSGKAITLELIRDKLGLVGVETLTALATCFVAHDSAGAIEKLHSTLLNGVSCEQLAADLADYFRTLLLLKHGIRNESVLRGYASNYPEELVAAFSVRQLEIAVEMLLEAHRRLRYALSQELELELLVSRLSRMDRIVTPDELLEKIEAIKGALFGGEASAPTFPAAPAAPAPPAPSFEMRPPQPTAATAPKSAPLAASGSCDGDEIDVVPVKPTIGLKPEETAAILRQVKHDKVTLSSMLEKAATWALRDDGLSILFDNTFSADFVRQEIPYLKNVIEKTLGRPVFIEVRVQAAVTDGEAGQNEQVEKIRRVFRGEIVGGGPK